MIILAIDVAKRASGYAVGDGNSPPRTGLGQTQGQSRGEAGHNYARWLRDLIAAEHPDLVVSEAPIRTAGKRTAVETMIVLNGLAFVTECVCHAARVPYCPVEISTWRKAFVGHGRPKDPKVQVLRMCTLLRWDVAGDDNRGDAAGIWTWAHLTHGNSRAMRRLLSDSSLRRMEART